VPWFCNCRASSVWRRMIFRSRKEEEDASQALLQGQHSGTADV
jgi:hypothetical protein